MRRAIRTACNPHVVTISKLQYIRERTASADRRSRGFEHLYDPAVDENDGEPLRPCRKEPCASMCTVLSRRALVSLRVPAAVLAAVLVLPGPPAAAVEPSGPPGPVLSQLKDGALYPSLFDTHDIVAYYGNPRSNRMGVLGEQPLPETARLIERRAAEYAELSRNDGRGVLPGFHLVYATVFPDGEFGRLPAAVVTEWIEYALDRDLLVILDHQIGRHSVRRAIEQMLPYLRYPNVHLAIDPEWATDVPGQEVGGVHAEEVNTAQQMIQEYLIEHDLSGRRVLVVHQFHYRMIEDAHLVRSDFERVDVVHNMDGFGPPGLKLHTWNYLLQFDNLPLKGFKLFYPKSWRAGGFDKPLMTPAEVLNLTPRPVFIQYQ